MEETQRKEKEKEKEVKLPFTNSFSKCQVWGQLELYPGVPHGWQGPNYWSSFL